MDCSRFFTQESSNIHERFVDSRTAITKETGGRNGENVWLCASQHQGTE